MQSIPGSQKTLPTANTEILPTPEENQKTWKFNALWFAVGAVEKPERLYPFLLLLAQVSPLLPHAQ